MSTLNPSHSSQSTKKFLLAGSQALAQGDWRKSHAIFQKAVAFEETPEALEGLATAAWWLDDAPVVFESRERAYRLYRQRADQLGAARMATGLGLDHYLYRGDVEIANAWLRWADRLLDGTGPSAERGWRALWEAHVVLFEHHDLTLAKSLCAESYALARSLGLTDLELLSLALIGLALVCEGLINEGMRQLDETTVAALAGETSNIDAIVTICCYLIYACERVRDYPRAVEWCEKVEEVARRWAYRSMFAFCRCHYAAVLVWKGEWLQAEGELTAATHELMTTRPGWAGESVVRLAELRKRQGRPDEAATLFSQVPMHPKTLLGLAELALDRGDTITANDLIDRFFRRISQEDRTERVAGAELAVRARIALGAIDEARVAADELEATARAIRTEPLEAIALLSNGRLLAASGNLQGARQCLEDAVDLFRHIGAPFETARARIQLAHVLKDTDRRSAAVIEVREAAAVFKRLGAAQELRRAASMFCDLGVSQPQADTETSSSANLTGRETEVLGLVAHGLTNHQIADELFISVRTVERHISSIYGKIGAEGSSARSVATVYALERGLARTLQP